MFLDPLNSLWLQLCLNNVFHEMVVYSKLLLFSEKAQALMIYSNYCRLRSTIFILMKMFHSIRYNFLYLKIFIFGVC